jgi:hypothetical protein
VALESLADLYAAVLTLVLGVGAKTQADVVVTVRVQTKRQEGAVVPCHSLSVCGGLLKGGGGRVDGQADWRSNRLTHRPDRSAEATD